MSADSYGYDIKEVSQNYAIYRPNYLPELYEKILQYLDEGFDGQGKRGLAVDIGCGCGHSTLMLAKHFETVIGIDTSENQLKEAMTASAEFGNVVYKLGSAETASSLVTAGSADLVTVGTALHWFEFINFYKECVKILKPHGILAIYVHYLPVCDNPEANGHLHLFYKETFKDYWQEPTKHVFNGYKEQWAILPQFFDQCIREDSMSSRYTSNLREVIGFIKTFPEHVFYKRDHPEQPDGVDLLLERLKEVFDTSSTEERIVKLRYPVTLLLGRQQLPRLLPHSI